MSWQEDAACRHLPTELFFRVRAEESTEALAACDSCTVSEQCGILGQSEPFGIWDGKGATARGYRSITQRHLPGTRTAKQRLVALIESSNGPWTAQDVAVIFGLTTETVARAMRDLVDQGVLTLHKRNRTARAVFSKPKPLPEIESVS